MLCGERKPSNGSSPSQEGKHPRQILESVSSLIKVGFFEIDKLLESLLDGHRESGPNDFVGIDWRDEERRFVFLNVVCIVAVWYLAASKVIEVPALPKLSYVRARPTN